MLPKELRKHLEDQLQLNILSSRRVSGGSINKAARIETDKEGTCFLKWNQTANPDLFVKEVKGLTLLRRTDTDLVVPEVSAQGITETGAGFLILRFIENGKPSDRSEVNFGRELARLHKHGDDQFGLGHDNYIGKLPQSNTRHAEWTDFFIEERIKPQLKLAADANYFSHRMIKAFQNLFSRLTDIFPKEPPSLLHGDLWGGNFFYDTEGKTVIYDPAVYYGHREMELAFTRLFGGFSSGFYEAYEESHPLAPGFRDRIDIYNLYPLLVHTNLFGRTYANQVESIISQFA